MTGDAETAAPRWHRAAEALSFEAFGARVIAIPDDGAVDVADLALLRGSARVLWEESDGGFTAAEWTERLEALGAPDRAEAAAQCRTYVADLESRGLIVADEPTAPATEAVTPPRPTAASPAPVRGWSAGELAVVLRALLALGVRVRFRAQGRSMRPSIPHGSTLEVEARAWSEVKRGDVLLYLAGDDRLVAHRALALRDGKWTARGDSAARLDEITRADHLGVVVAIVGSSGERLDIDSTTRRWTGLVSGAIHRFLTACARVFLIAPMRWSLQRPSIVRGALGFLLRVLNWILRRSERAAFGLRRRVEVLRAALLSSREKDRLRQKLYAREGVRDFTARDENVEAGLTLLEEVLLTRHPPPRGKALVIGCGPGREGVALARRGWEVTGVDRDAGMLERARAFAERSGVTLRLLEGEALDPTPPGETYDTIVVFSGLYNMVLPRDARVRLLEAARDRLAPHGRVLVTFLSEYRRPGSPPPARTKTLLEAMNPEHEAGDRFLLNEAVHVFPDADDVLREAREAGLAAEAVHRDQRAYDRERRQVRGYVVLRHADPATAPA